ncbi:DUF3040 domain-containing protein [Corynebacterium sp. 35RC1]|nr:DUF3040 domain-containing protein [Corynebacterium sp. 35RC1]
MALSEQERRALQEIERSLLADDPKFGASVKAVEGTGGSGALTLRGVAVVVIGLVMLVAGVALAQQSLAFIGISIAGFLVMLAGGIWMLKSGGGASGAAANGQGASLYPAGGGARGSQTKQSSNGFSSRMEENFRKRFEE